MNPDEVIKAAKEDHADNLIPVHRGAYLYGSFPWYQPPEDIAAAADGDVSLAYPLIGHIYSYDELKEQNDYWWEKYK